MENKNIEENDETLNLKDIKNFLKENYLSNIFIVLSILWLCVTAAYQFLSIIQKLPIYHKYGIDTRIILYTNFEIGNFLYYALEFAVFLLIYFVYKYFPKNKTNWIKRFALFICKHFIIEILLVINIIFFQMRYNGILGLIFLSIIFDVFVKLYILFLQWLLSFNKDLDKESDRSLSSDIKEFFFFLLLSFVIVGFLFYAISYSNPSNEIHYYINDNDERRIIVDINNQKAIACAYDNNTIDCNKYIKIINLNDYYLYRITEET